MKLSRYKHSSSFSYAFGATLIFELLNTYPNQITRIFLRPNLKHGNDLKKLLTQLEQHKIDVIESTKAFNILGAKENCLIIAEFKKPANQLDHDINTPHIVLVNPSDSGNLGTIFRTALAFNYENIAIITPAVDHFSPKTIRASMGAVFHLNIETLNTFDDYLSKYGYLQERKTTKRALYSFMLSHRNNRIQSIQPQNSFYSLIFGNEASGLPDSFTDISQTVFIPQSPKVDSLNLAISASIGMYHFSNTLSSN